MAIPKILSLLILAVIFSVAIARPGYLGYGLGGYNSYPYYGYRYPFYGGHYGGYPYFGYGHGYGGGYYGHYL